MFKAYKYRLYPTDQQKIFFAKNFGCTRWVYNFSLQKIKEQWEKNKDKPKEEREKMISAFDLNNYLPNLKKIEEFSFLKEADSTALCSSNLHLEIAFKNFFNNLKKGVTPGYPKFKNKFNKQSYCPNYQAVSVNFEKQTILIPKLGEVICIFHRSFEGKIKTCTISKTPAQNYFISILVDNNEELPKKQEIKEDTTIGVDWGLKTFATLSNGEEIKRIRFFKDAERILQIEQRKLSRRHKKGAEKQSKSYLKQKIHVAKLNERIANQRNNFLHNVSASLIKHFDTICVEDLNVKGMSSSAKGTVEDPGKNVKQKAGLNKSILDTSPGKFISQLEYKCSFNGKNLLKADKFYASSKNCSCGIKNNNLSLSDRIWVCECGKVNERDLNAAINIKKHCLEKVL